MKVEILQQSDGWKSKLNRASFLGSFRLVGSFHIGPGTEDRCVLRSSSYSAAIISNVRATVVCGLSGQQYLYLFSHRRIVRTPL